MKITLVHGTLSNTGLCILDTERKTVVRKSVSDDYLTSLQEVFELALSNGVTYLWIMASAGITPTKEFAMYDEASWDLSRQNWTSSRQQPCLITVAGWKTGGGQQQVNITFVATSSWGKEKRSWAYRATPKELLVTFHYVEQALRIQVAGSPSTVGWHLLKTIHPKWIETIHADLHALHFGAESAHDLVWENKWDGKGLYLHKFDKNSAYLAAAETEFFGLGRLQKSTSYDEKPKKGEMQVGVWLCTARQTRASELPPIFEEEPVWTAWIAGPVIRLLRSQGYEVEVHEGVQFEECHQLLSGWCIRLWNARQSFKQDTQRWIHPVARIMAAEAIKQVAVVTIGLTDSAKLGDDESEKKRPDIKMQTAARTYEVMYHNIIKFRQLYNVLPLLVYTDALYYMSDNPNGDRAFPEIAVRWDKLGGYKYEGRIEITSEVRALLAERINVYSKLEYLNKKIGWIK